MLTTKRQFLSSLSKLLLVIPLIVGCKQGYEIDKNEVYYNYWNEGTGSHNILIKKADSRTFKSLNSFYAKDKNYAYYDGEIITASDSKTFQALADFYAKDDISAFYLNEKIKGADGKSFEVVNHGDEVYAKDNIDFYHNGTPLHVSDLKSFKILGNGWAKDKSYYYLSIVSALTNKYPLADYESFDLLKAGYAKDKFQVYYYGNVLKGADPNSFKVINYTKAQDKNNCYKDGSVTDCN